MRRALLIFVALVVLVSGGVAEASSFTVDCTYSHSAPDDPIVFPSQPGASHMHDFFGARTTDAFSTYESLRASATTCGNRADTAGYWTPQATYNGTVVHPILKAYYYDKIPSLPQPVPFPAGLQMVAGDSHATAPQPKSVVYFGCGNGSGISGVTYLPDCTGIGVLQVHVLFPDCWDQSGLTRSDVSYSARGICPAGSVRMPQLIERFRYPMVIDAAGFALSSGAFYTMHADFFNAWEPDALAAKVANL